MMCRSFSALVSTDEKCGESAIHAQTGSHADTFFSFLFVDQPGAIDGSGWLLGYDLSIAKPNNVTAAKVAPSFAPCACEPPIHAMIRFYW